MEYNLSSLPAVSLVEMPGLLAANARKEAEMGSGKRPKGRDGGRIGVPTRRGTGGGGGGGSGGNGGGGGGNGPTAGAWCRTFGLMRPTANARKAGAGMPVSGEVAGLNVIVDAGIGKLGEAPAQMAQSIIAELNKRGGGSLSGFVMKKTDSDVRVKLCIK